MKLHLKAVALLGALFTVMLFTPMAYGNSFDVQIVSSFTTTLQPGVLHGFILGPVSTIRGFVAEVSPLDPSDDGAHVQSFVQPEFNGSVWYDVLRVQLLASSTPVNADINVYSLSVKSGKK